MIIPALNEEATLARVVRDVLGACAVAGVTGEVVLVDDGSSDGTARIADELAASSNQIRVIHHRCPAGIGSAFRSGLALARHEAVACFPADGENEPRELVNWLPLLAEVEMVVPYPLNPDVRPRGRQLLSWTYRELINRGFGTRFRYTNGTTLYRRAVLADLPPVARGFLFQAELLVRTVRAGARYREVGTILHPRPEGASKAIAWAALRQMASDAYHVWRSLTRERIYG